MTPVNEELDLWGDGPRPTLIGERIRLCRHAMGWKTVRLAEELSKTTSAINLWEAGHRQPQEVLSELCRVLDVSPAGLAQEAPPVPSSGPFFRSMLRKESLRLRDHATAYLRLTADLATYLERRVGLSSSGDSLIGTIEARTPGAAAHEARQRLSVPLGPVDNMIRCAESMGAVTAFGLAPSRVGIDNVKSVDAYSAIVGRWPIIVMTSRGDYYRQRWDVAHELGHLILHDSEVEISEQAEHEANQFAAEFLLPADQVSDAVPTSAARSQELIAALTPIKERWGVSYRAILRRSRELDRMHESTFQRANRILDERGWRTYEPGKMQMLEMPHRLPEALARYIGYGAEREVILREVGIPRLLFESIVSRRPIDIPPVARDTPWGLDSHR